MRLETIGMRAKVQGVKVVLPFRLGAGKTERAGHLSEAAIVGHADESWKKQLPD
jgi:hypothetical protein